MKGRLYNLATILSAALSLAALAMQVRSGYATDSWELAPRPAPNFNAEFRSGWVTHRHIESTGGRLVWVSYGSGEVRLVPPVSYQVATEPLAPGQRGRDDNRPVRYSLPPLLTEHGQIPGVAEWYAVRQAYAPYIYFALSWPLLIVLFALLPVARLLWGKRRPRASKGPAFPILPPQQ